MAGAIGVILVLSVYFASKPKDLHSITGAVLRQDPDLGKQLPIANAQIFLGDDLSNGAVSSDSAGRFQLHLRPGVRVGQLATLQVRTPATGPWIFLNICWIVCI